MFDRILYFATWMAGRAPSVRDVWGQGGGGEEAVRSDDLTTHMDAPWGVETFTTGDTEEFKRLMEEKTSLGAKWRITHYASDKCGTCLE